MDQATLTKVAMLGLYSDRPGSGKDTFGAQLAALYPQVKLLSFAAPLAADVQAMFPDVQDFMEIRNDTLLKDWKFSMFSLKRVNPDFDKYVAFCVSKLGMDMDAKLSARDHLILYGTKYIREFLGKQDHWLSQGFAQAKQAYSEGRVPVFTDVRFPHEAQKLRQCGGLVFKIQPTWSKELSATTSIAEGNLKDYPFDSTLWNVQGTPEDMLRQFHKNWTL